MSTRENAPTPEALRAAEPVLRAVRDAVARERMTSWSASLRERMGKEIDAMDTVLSGIAALSDQAALRAECAGLRERTWRPIATAPRDGTWVLLGGLQHGPSVQVGYWGAATYNRSTKKFDHGWTTGPNELRGPTCWMPIPTLAATPPAPGDEAAGLDDLLSDALAFVQAQRRVCSVAELGPVIALAERLERALAGSGVEKTGGDAS